MALITLSLYLLPSLGREMRQNSLSLSLSHTHTHTHIHTCRCTCTRACTISHSISASACWGSLIVNIHCRPFYLQDLSVVPGSQLGATPRLAPGNLRLFLGSSDDGRIWAAFLRLPCFLPNHRFLKPECGSWGSDRPRLAPPRGARSHTFPQRKASKSTGPPNVEVMDNAVFMEGRV